MGAASGGNRDLVEQALKHLFDADAIGHGVVRQLDAVAQHRVQYSAQIVRTDKLGTFQPGIGPRCTIQADRPARAGADHEFTANHLIARLEQFFDETFVIVPHAADALASGDVPQFGSLVDRSQGGAERALENQVAETVHLARYARDLGAHAASAFGAGFGGSVWAMVPASDAERFASRWRDRYLRTHAAASHRALFFSTRPSAPAFEVVGDTMRADA